MGIWAEIKYALNSTLGTSNFSPVDEIIKNGNTALTNRLSTADNHVQSLRGGTKVHRKWNIHCPREYN